MSHVVYWVYDNEDAMKLRDYLYYHDIQIKDFAKAMGYDRNTIGRIANGRMKATERFKKLVYKETNGAVCLEDWSDIKTHNQDDPNQLLLFG